MLSGANVCVIRAKRSVVACQSDEKHAMLISMATGEAHSKLFHRNSKRHQKLAGVLLILHIILKNQSGAKSKL